MKNYIIKLTFFLLFMPVLGFCKKTSLNQVTITITYVNSKEFPTSLSAYYSKNALYADIAHHYTSKIEFKKTGRSYKVILPVTKYGYISVLDNDLKPFLDWYFVEEGDNIKITVDQSKKLQLNFSGFGSQKYLARYRPEMAVYYDSVAQSQGAMALQAKELKILLSFKNKISDISYNVLKADIIGKYGTRMEMNNSFELAKPNFDTTSNEFKESYWTTYYDDNDISDDGKVISHLYSPFFWNKTLNDYRLNNKGQKSDTAVYFKMYKMVTSQKLQDKLGTYLIINYGNQLKHLSLIFNDSIHQIKNKEFLAEIEKFRMMLPGQKAFDFQLPDINGNMIKLSDFKGKTVFIDFWYTGCANCMIFYQSELRNIEERYKDDPNVVFMTVCIDKSKDQWLKSVNSGSYTSGHAVNLYTGGTGANSPVILKYNIFGYPQPLIVDKNVNIFTFESSRLRHETTAVPAIEAAKAIAQEEPLPNIQKLEN
ncbi:AhpC/TSA family protein [bacterium A37T11]|nr:AhpC/TSA family protein [bacterium A37T11]